MLHPLPIHKPPPRPERDATDWTLVRRMLERTAIGLTGRRTEAEDLVQRTLAHLLERRPERAAHIGYARQTLTRLWLDEQRSLRRRVRRLARLAAGAMSDLVGTETPHAQHTDHERDHALQAAIDRLPPRQRAVIVLRLVEEMPTAAIAETLACTEEAVRSNLHLARMTLRRTLSPNWTP